MAKVFGRATVKVDGGTTLKSKEGASLVVGGVTREDEPNDQGTVDYRENTQPAEVTATLVHTTELDVIGLQKFAGGPVNFELDTGEVFVVPGAYVKEIGSMSSGEVEVTFGGNPAERLA